MNYKQASELEARIRQDLDIIDEPAVPQAEIYYALNEGIKGAASQINTLYEDYFLTRAGIPAVQGGEEFALPPNIYANKIRYVGYRSGSIFYEILRLRNQRIFERIDMIQFSGTSDEYQYILTNHSSTGKPQAMLVPPSRETVGQAISAITIANPGVFTSVAHGLSTGDQIRLQASSLPTGLAAQITYFVNKLTADTFSVSATRGGTAIQTTGLAGSNMYWLRFPYIMPIWYIRSANVVTTATDLVDIPEFEDFVVAHAKYYIVKNKPGFGDVSVMKADRDEKMADMITTLSKMVPDDHSEMAMDLRHYEEHL